jgi:hypothetical protein
MSPATDIDDHAPSSWLARTAAGASIAVHVAALALTLGYAGASYESEPEAVPVSVVTPDELVQDAVKESAPPPEEKLDLRASLENTPPDPLMQPPQAETKPAAANTKSGAPSQPSSPPAPQKTSAAPSSPPPQQQPRPQPAYTPPPPDISLQYGIDLGLKELSVAAAPVDTPRDGKSDFDEVASSKADIDKSSIAAFRARLRDCAPLPAQVSPDDKVVIVMRASFTKDARLAAEPVLIEASASAKGPLLMKAAIAALEKCQPHVALPPEKYAEWRVLDLRFTPQDFRRG